MVNSTTVIEALRRFLPEYLERAPPLCSAQRRAIWAITHCRTVAMGGRSFACDCHDRLRFAYHSCNHKACPQCGRAATARWVQRELSKLVGASYFLVTFTLPSQLRECFFGPFAKEAYDLFFKATSAALSEKLSSAKDFPARVHGFTGVLHTWNQRLEFHPHIHYLVPGVGLDRNGQIVQVRYPHFLVHLPLLRTAFREEMRQLLADHGWEVNPQVWTIHWGVHIRPVGSGASALKYLGTYVARTAISDQRMIRMDASSVTFRWKDRADHGRSKSKTLPGEEFIARYLRHVLPKGLRSIRYYGFCHPSAKATRLRIQFHSGVPVELGASAIYPPPTPWPICPDCKAPLRLIGKLAPLRCGSSFSRGPPALSKMRLPLTVALCHEGA